MALHSSQEPLPALQPHGEAISRASSPSLLTEADTSRHPSMDGVQGSSYERRPEQNHTPDARPLSNLDDYEILRESQTSSSTATERTQSRQESRQQTQAPSTSPTQPPHPNRKEWLQPLWHREQEPIVSWWWWWEIMATLLSIGCIVALSVILSKIDNTPLEAWWLPIQPNSLISVLTTVAKAAIMVPAASCISQLKWRHFHLRSRRLADFGLFEDASRGPWGSAMLLTQLTWRTRVLVAAGFALVTILALGFDASAQQVLDFPLQESELTNQTIEIGKADMYNSKGSVTYDPDTVEETTQNPDLLALQLSLINGAFDHVFQPHFTCPAPATRCTWDEFTTLGVCLDFENVTNFAAPDCTPYRPDTLLVTEETTTTIILNCTYTWPGPRRLDLPGSKSGQTTMRFSQPGALTGNPTLFKSSFWDGYSNTTNSLGLFQAVKTTSHETFTWSTDGNQSVPIPPPVALLSGTLSWCAQTYKNLTASPTGITFSERTEDLLTTILVHNTSFDIFQSNKTGALYEISAFANLDVAEYLGSLLTTTLTRGPAKTLRNDARRDRLIDFALYISDIGVMLHNLAETLSNQIRSKDPGDNLNATTVAGRAYFREPYIRVRWPWMTLPIAETVLAAALLLISMIATRHEPLLKTSVLAYLGMKSEDWGEDELQVGPTQTQEKLAHSAEAMWATIDHDHGGSMRWRRMPKPGAADGEN